jgi:glycosyltransferase involved in cell wall biosynthesis
MINFAIVIATYQRPDGKSPFYVKRALESVKNQTYQNYKVFLIGDKYEDDVEFQSFGRNIEDGKIYRENLPTAYEREKYINKKHVLWTCGGVFANNFGFDLALNEDFTYICPLDHDDWWEPTHLENFKQLIEDKNSHFVCSKSNHISNKVLPSINSEIKEKFLEFLPGSGGLIKSSSCIDMKSIPLMFRNVYEEDGNAFPSDADYWERVREHIKRNNLNSFLVNEITCNHLEEGYTQRM